MTEILPHQAVDPKTFRQALAHHAAGVVIITAAPEADTGPGAASGVAGTPVGLTATSFSSVSLDPPLVSFYVDRSSTTWPALRTAYRFAVNILSGDQPDLATRFARRGIDRFAPPTDWHRDAHGTPLLDGVCAHLHCLPHTTVDIGDHILVVGLVTGADPLPDADPLLYHQGRFGQFHPHDRR